MPYLLIQTDKTISEEQQSKLLADASQIVATALGKPAKYVMAAWAPASKMIFDSSADSCVFLELRSIGIAETGRPKIAGALSKCMSDHLGVNPDRVYLVMMDVPAKYWGQGAQTFG